MNDRKSPQPQVEQESPISAVLAYLILLGGIATIAISAYMVIAGYSSLPYSDGWTQIFAANSGENPLSLRWLWRQHNEHRLVIPKLFLVADLRFFRARQVLLLASIFAIQFLHWMLLCWSMRALGGWRGALWRTGAGLAAFCLFCPSQWENLTWGFQTCFVLPGLFATCAFVSLLLYWSAARDGDRPHAWKFLLFSIAAALGATYSLASGNLLWPLLIAAAVVLRLRLAVVLSYAVTGTISTALYLHGYVRPLQNSDPAASIRSPLKLLEYFAVYLGSSWVRQSIGVAAFCGILGLLIALIFLVRSGRSSADSPFRHQLVLTLLFCLGTGLLTALGRVNAGDMQAFSSRYQTIALLFWCCLGLLLLGASGRGFAGMSSVGVQLVLLTMLLRGAILARFPLRNAREHAFQMHAAAAALITGVDDSQQLQEAFPHSEYVWNAAPFMRENRLSIFVQDTGPKLGERFDSVFALASSDECVGALQSVSAMGAGAAPALRITGWAWDVKRRRPPASVVTVADGAIAGLGAVGDWRPTIRAANPYLKTSFIGFVAYAKEVNPSVPIRVYGIVSEHPAQACYVAKVVPGVP
ncbi:MAG: hypothetical protein WA655_23550 [Candidatus Korobacteraceae bacterium]